MGNFLQFSINLSRSEVIPILFTNWSFSLVYTKNVIRNLSNSRIIKLHRLIKFKSNVFVVRGPLCSKSYLRSTFTSRCKNKSKWTLNTISRLFNARSAITVTFHVPPSFFIFKESFHINIFAFSIMQKESFRSIAT